MKILYSSYIDLDTPSACQTHTLGVLRGFSANGCRVDALVPRPSVPCEIPAVRFYYTSTYQGRKRYLLREIPYSALLLIYLCRKNNYDAIYARDMDVFIGPRLCSRLFRLPLYLEVDDTPVEGTYPAAIRKLVERNLRLDYQQAAGLIVPSVPRCQLIQQRYGIPPHKTHMILNGTEILNAAGQDRAEVKRRLRLPEGSFCLGYVGTINERYDFDTLLAAMVRCLAYVPQLHLIIVGGGSRLEQVKRNVMALGLGERATFTGFVQQSKLAEILPAIDLGLMILKKAAVMEHGPIHTKLATYAIFAVPVITAGSSLLGYPEAIRRGVFLVPPEDVDALAEMILHLYDNSLERKTVADSLHDYVMRKLAWKAVTADILAIMGKQWKPASEELL